MALTEKSRSVRNLQEAGTSIESPAIAEILKFAPELQAETLRRVSRLCRICVRYSRIIMEIGLYKPK